MKHFAYPATIFSCVKQPLQGEKKNNIKISKTDCSSMCLMVLKPSPVCHVLAGLVLRFPMSAPSVCPPCPCPQSLQPSSETPTARKGAQMPPAPCTDRQTDSKAHPPPLIRLRSESTSSAPSMATSSCRKRRNLVWKPLLCSILGGCQVPGSSQKCH